MKIQYLVIQSYSLDFQFDFNFIRIQSCKNSFLTIFAVASIWQCGINHNNNTNLEGSSYKILQKIQSLK